MLWSISSLLLLISAAQALPWDGPCTTGSAEILPLLRDQDLPRPTAAAELLKRQEPGDVLCAWEDGLADSSMALYCRSQKVCATNSLGVFGCCDAASIDDCALYTTCVDSTAADAYASSYGSDTYAITCNLPQNPICITEYIELAVTVTGWLCGPTTSANPQTYYPSDYNVTAASTETPIYRNAVFDGYTPLTLLNPTTSTSSSSSSTPSTTTAPSTTSSPSPTSTSSTSTTSPPTPTPAPASSSSTPIGAIVGGVIGGLAVIALVILAIILIRRRNKKNNATTTTAAHPPYSDGGVAPMHQIPQGSPPIQQNPQYPTQPGYQYGDPALQKQQQQQPQYAQPQYAQPQPYTTDGALAGAYAPAAYPEKSPAQTSVSPQMSNYSSVVAPAGGVGQEHRGSAAAAPMYSPTASELGAGGRESGMSVAKGLMHELGE